MNDPRSFEARQREYGYDNKVRIIARTEGVNFGVVGVVKRFRGGDVTVAVAEKTRPLGFESAALSDARELAQKLGYEVVAEGYPPKKGS